MILKNKALQIIMNFKIQLTKIPRNFIFVSLKKILYK